MAPTFATKPTIRQDEDGSTLIFHCAIMADPRPAITWYHNGVKVQDSDKFQVWQSHAWQGSFTSGYIFRILKAEKSVLTI